jgi:zinc protease
MHAPILKTTLDNGLTVVLREMHHAPVTSFWVWYRVGSRNEIPGITGVSHWVEHMMFKGSPQFPPGSLDRAVSREGGRWNAFTTNDFTDSERTVIISERRMYENQPGFLLREELTAAAFRVHPYHHEVIGDEADLETMTRDDLYGHYRRFYAPNNAVIVVTGDFETEKMLAQVDSYFGEIPAAETNNLNVRPEPPQRGERRITVRGPGDTAYLAGGGNLGSFGGGATNKSSRLYKSLVATDLAAAVSGNVSPSIDPYLYSIYAVARPGRSLADIEAALEGELERLTTEPLTQTELDKALKRAKAQFVMAGESVSGQGQMIGMAEAVAGDYGWYEHALEALGAITLEDIAGVLEQYLVKDNRVVGLYEPAGENN